MSQAEVDGWIRYFTEKQWEGIKVPEGSERDRERTFYVRGKFWMHTRGGVLVEYRG